MKKILSLLMVIAVLFSCNVEVFAAGNEYSFTPVCTCTRAQFECYVEGSSGEMVVTVFCGTCWDCVAEFTCTEKITGLIREDGVTYDLSITTDKYPNNYYAFISLLPGGYTYYCYYEGYSETSSPCTVKGNKVTYAEHYELYLVENGQYEFVDMNATIDFDLSSYSLQSGDHVFVVKAVALGFEDSNYSNEIVYTVE